MNRRNVRLVAVVILLGCQAILLSPYRAVAQTPTSVPATSPGSSGNPPPPQSPTQRAGGILDRAQALRQVADNAVQLDGTPEAAQVRQQLVGCRADKKTCFESTKGFEQQSKTGALSGLAGYLTQPLAGYIFARAYGSSLPMDLRPILQEEVDVTFAEGLVKQAMDEAQKVADARAERQKKLDEQGTALAASADSCVANEAACKSRCEKGEPMFCSAWAVRLRNARPPKLADARRYFQRACDGDVLHACDAIPGVDEQIQRATARMESLWGAVVAVGDDLTQKVFAAEKLEKVATAPHLIRALEQLRTINRATVAERYCPAKKEFLAVATASEFGQRVAAHCRDQAPTGAGLSGAWITLTSQCQAVYATACP
jgi:hypothetical protein